MRAAFIIILPVLLAAAGAAAGYAYRMETGAALETAVIAGAAVFYTLMVLVIYLAVHLRMRRMRRELAAYSAYEAEVIRKLDDVLKSRADGAMLRDVAERVANLEASAIARPAETATGGDRAGPGEAAETAAGPANGDDEKVVRLVTGKPDTAKRGQDERTRRELRRQIAGALRDARMVIRLQPAVDLMSRKTVAVEASVWLPENGEASMAFQDCAAILDSAQKTHIDRFAVSELSRVLKMMDDDGQVIPVFYRFLLPGAATEDAWAHILQRLAADARLARNLVAVGDADLLRKSSQAQVTRFAELRETGARLGISGIRNVNGMGQVPESVRCSHAIVETRDLLGYLPGSNRRAGEELVPALTRAGIEPVATGVSERHHASGLLDLDIAIAIGDLISPPRNIRLYAKASSDSRAGDKLG